MFSLSLTGIANFTRGLFIFYISLSLTRQFRKGIGIKARWRNIDGVKKRWEEKMEEPRSESFIFSRTFFL